MTEIYQELTMTDRKTPLDSPALQGGSAHYPEAFGNRVPCRILMLHTVRSEVPFHPVDQPRPVAAQGLEYDCTVNRNGAVAALVEGEELGVRPGEFEVVGWHLGEIAVEARLPVPRRWEVTFSYTETVVVKADTEEEAEERAEPPDLCEPTIVRVHQISGPPPVEPTVDLQLIDGRSVTLPLEYHPWFKVDGAPSEWWTNGRMALALASPVAEHRRDKTRTVDWGTLQRVLPTGAQPAELLEGEREYNSAEGDLILTCRSLRMRLQDMQERTASVDVRYLPLVHCPETGIVPRVSSALAPVLGYRGDELVAVVMPVRS